MQEHFLHFIWRTGRFDQRQLLTTDRQTIQVLQRGQYQGHAGPDFNAAHIQIGSTIWHGQVEMHLQASEWYRHKHHLDPAYDGTILHVVWEEDQPVFRRDGTRLPCLELRGRVESSLLARYHRLIREEPRVPCHFALAEIPELTKRTMLDRALIERLERKARDIQHLLRQQQGDWAETVWLCLAAGLGQPVNAEPMLQLARSLPLQLLQRYRHHPLQVEALIFGQAGMLDETLSETYPQQLFGEYRFLQHKHHLTPLPPGQWKYLRMRPTAFPTLRLARLAALAVHHEHALANILAAATPQEWMNSLEVSLPPYWTRHYRFGVNAAAKRKNLGQNTARSLVINVMAPLLFAYGLERQESRWQEKALDMLCQLPAELNHITARWSAELLPSHTAADSQGLLELEKNYCIPRRCLQCAIGCQLLSTIRQGQPLMVEEALFW